MRLHLRVKPGARKSVCLGWDEGALLLSVHAPAHEGAANKEVLRFLAEVLDLPKTSLILKNGFASSFKTVEVPAHEAWVQEKLLKITRLVVPHLPLPAPTDDTEARA